MPRLPSALHRRTGTTPATPTPEQGAACSAARATLADALQQIDALRRYHAAAAGDPVRLRAIAGLRADAEAAAAAARQAVQQYCGALLLVCRSPVTLTTVDDEYLGTARAELLLEPDGRWGGMIEHYPEASPPTVPVPGSELLLELHTTGQQGHARIVLQLPTPTRTTVIEGNGPAPFA